MAHKMVSFAEKPIHTQVEVGRSKKRIYYPSFDVPLEAFGGKVPTVGSTYRMEIVCEVKEVRKTDDYGTSIRAEIRQGKVLGSKGQKTMEEFQKMKPKQREKYQEDSMMGGEG